MELNKLVGNWKGTCKTWFEPDVLADESEIAGSIQAVLNGRFFRHVYQGSIKGKPRRGEELITINGVTSEVQVCWMDDFHMSYAILVCLGNQTDSGLNVRGNYDVGQGHPRWGWRTEYQLVGDDGLSITAFNVSPEGDEAKAVEIDYRRTSDQHVN